MHFKAVSLVVLAFRISQDKGHAIWGYLKRPQAPGVRVLKSLALLCFCTSLYRPIRG